MTPNRQPNASAYSQRLRMSDQLDATIAKSALNFSAKATIAATIAPAPAFFPLPSGGESTR